MGFISVAARSVRALDLSVACRLRYVEAMHLTLPSFILIIRPSVMTPACSAAVRRSPFLGHNRPLGHIYTQLVHRHPGL